ncbi:MAG: HD domain-containing phosphohydrolase [Chloroflexota bacterium]
MEARAFLAPSARQPARRPNLLLLVYGAVLVLVAVTASALLGITSGHIQSSSLRAVVDRDRALVALFVRDHILGTDLQGSVSPARSAELEEQLAALTSSDAILRIVLLDRNGRVVAADVPGLRGTVLPVTGALEEALSGEPSATVQDKASSADVPGPAMEPTSIIAEYLPILADSRQLGVVALWRDASLVLTTIAAARTDVLVVTLTAAVILSALLFLIFRAAQLRLARQQEQLIAATREDSLTGLLNHGAVVALLTDAIESSARRSDRLAVALIDIDNFKLLNDTHAHEAGDEVLVRVAELLPAGSREHDHVARYGPDEFLIVRSGTSALQMEEMVTDMRSRLATMDVQFGDSDRLPVTVSVGIAVIPDHADGVTELLAAAAAALGNAKESGGDQVRVAQRADPNALSPTFDVLHGLVIAVDTKDRYTRRHSEDVARYALFLGRRLGLDDEALGSLHVSGLLHDIGKIGIPDTILRKPGKLTDDEYRIFKQHVTLGDSIVRDLPNIEVVRAGIRTHHERWDGAGYVSGLEGQEIPLIGRILAVADAFSAMTTSRPYRKALDVAEALKRLGDAAGTQLEEDLVASFIKGIETADDAPLPGDDAGLIWLPNLQVA